MSTSTAAARSMREIIAHILDTHHAYLRNELPFLEERIAKMTANHGQDRPELFKVQQTLQDLRDDLTSHMQKEEQVLFPYIADLEAFRESGGVAPHGCFPSVRFPIRMMLMEHEGASDLLMQLRESTGGYSPPAGLCDCGREFYQRLQGLDKDLTEHIRVENDILFPRAVWLEEMGQ